MELVNTENYGFYIDLVKNGYQVIDTNDLNDENIDTHFNNIIAILNDGIEDEKVANFKIHIIFPDDELDLYIIQYMFNLMFWSLIVCTGRKIMSYNLFFEEVITKKEIKKYIDDQFIRMNLKTMELISLNQNIDRCIGKFRDLINFQMYLCNTLDFKDTVDFMNEFPEFNDDMHLDISNVPMEDVKEYGMKATNNMIDYIKMPDRDHNAKYPFISKEGINAKQFKEVVVNIGTKPNGKGGVFPRAIPTSFVNGGLQTIEDVLIDSSIGRIAQILTKQNVGQSGAFSRRLGLNNQDTKLHYDPNYICDTVNFQPVLIKNKDFLEAYNMRYYRFKENGLEYLLDARKDQHLIGQTLLFRSPMTCASAARGNGVCYRCYGDLAYANYNISVGQMAADLLSSIYTQTLLSAKHLLESAIIKMNWVSEFYDYFNVEFDQIEFKSDLDLKKIKIIISDDDIIENDSDDEESSGPIECNYVYSFTVRYGNNDILIKTSEEDPIYITNDLADIMVANGTNEEDVYELDGEKLKDISLFMIDVKNDELSKVMKQVKNLIDNKSSIKGHNRETLLEAFIDANLAGRIHINAVHFEILLMNQIRAQNDILLKPDWTHKNEQCQILTLDQSLIDNYAITIRLQSTKLKRTLIHPSNRYLHSPSNMDLFSVEQPQKFIDNRDFEPTIPDEERDRKVIKPFVFTKDYYDKLNANQ